MTWKTDFSLFIDLLSALGTIAIPVLLLVWAPRIAKSGQRQAKEEIDCELKAYFKEVRTQIEDAQHKFPANGYGEFLGKDGRDEIIDISVKLQKEIDLGLSSYLQTMNDAGRGSFAMTTKALKSEAISAEMAKVRQADLDDWIENPKKKVSNASGNTHFVRISDCLDQIENVIFDQ